MTEPLLSFIVLSYNYEEYIGQTIRSILAQTVSDFEVVVVDDVSSDGSRDVVRSFDDSRIRLIVNERNLGGAGAYNVAVSAARGPWLVNLDADDWIEPEKSARQLDAVDRDPRLDVVGSWVRLADANGHRHPDADAIEPIWNKAHALNTVDRWIGLNYLCRSSTMVRRSTHLQIGFDDEGMVAAPDYELWTRAFSKGCRFGLVHEHLTYSRLQPRGVTRANLTRSYTEMAYAMLRNLVPYMEGRALWTSFRHMLNWLALHPELPALGSRERERLFGTALMGDVPSNYAAFTEQLSTSDPVRERAGRRMLSSLVQPQMS